MIEQGSQILRHARAVIGCWIIKLARCTMPSIVERDDASACLYQRRNPARIDPIHVGRRCKPVHEHDRLTLPLIKKCDFDPVARKPPHRPKGHGLLPGAPGQAFSMRCDAAHRDEMSASRSAKLVAPA